MSLVMENINSRIQQVIVDKLGVNESTITDQSNFSDDLAVDSLDFCELMVDIEKTFNIVIEDDLYPKLKTVGDVVKLVEQKAKTSPAPQYA